MSAVSMNEAAKKTAQLENAKEARPPGGAPHKGAGKADPAVRH